MRTGSVFVSGLCLLLADTASAGEWSGFAALDLRFYAQSAAYPVQNNTFIGPSVVLQPEWRQEWNEGKDRFTAIAFGRYDALDERRSHWDVREFNWLHQAENWDLRLGVGKVFWGVTESRHLVDIVNQTDLVEDLDGEDKLGQPMANLNVPSDYGNFSFFFMPYFRERTFPGPRGRVRFEPPVDTKRPEYHGADRWHPDLAFRWSRTFGDWDVGLSQFWGIGREPRLVPRFDRGMDGAPTALVPHYDVIDQTSLDVQGATGNWLWKLEAITRGGQGRRFGAVVAGFEYTFYGVTESGADLGLLLEYQYDGRDQIAAPPTPFNNDIFVGTRFSMNDAQSTELLLGVTIDLETQATVASLEASRRIGDNWRIDLEARLFQNIPDSDVLLKGMRQDDYVQLRISRFF